MSCQYDYSRGNGTGVAEAVGNWGFSNGISSNGHELRRIKCLLNKMENLHTCTENMQVIYDPRQDPEAWPVKPSPEECKPTWMFPMKRPLITYNSTSDIIVVSNIKKVGGDLAYPIPGRNYYAQGTDKWYKQGPDCCPQPSCPAIQCRRPYC